MFRDGLAARGIEELPAAPRHRASTRRRARRTSQSGETLPYDLFVGIPVHRAPDPLAASGLAVNGWVPVDQTNLRTQFPQRLRHRRRLHRPAHRPQGRDLRRVGRAGRRRRHRGGDLRRRSRRRRTEGGASATPSSATGSSARSRSTSSAARRRRRSATSRRASTPPRRRSSARPGARAGSGSDPEAPDPRRTVGSRLATRPTIRSTGESSGRRVAPRAAFALPWVRTPPQRSILTTSAGGDPRCLVGRHRASRTASPTRPGRHRSEQAAHGRSKAGAAAKRMAARLSLGPIGGRRARAEAKVHRRENGRLDGCNGPRDRQPQQPVCASRPWSARPGEPAGSQPAAGSAVSS